MKMHKMLAVAFAATSLAMVTPLQDDQQQEDRGADGGLDVGPLYTVKISPEETRLVTDAEKWHLKNIKKPFMDITDHADSIAIDVTTNPSPVFPEVMSHTRVVRRLLPLLSKNIMQSNLQIFSDFYNRYYESEYGQRSSEWLFTQVQRVVDASGADNVTVSRYSHRFPQNSIIATIPGMTSKTIIVGAHQDSINLTDRTGGRAPGADDNGSGTVAILEAFRVLLSNDAMASGDAPNTVEFHWYAGEEAGLLGSMDIFQAYAKDRRDVKAMLNLDMAGFVKGTMSSGRPVSIGIGHDRGTIDLSLASFVERVITTYCAIPFVNMTCGYACSDHASVAAAGYPSAFLFESTHEDSNPDLHTDRDNMSTVDFDHILEHSKAAVGFVFELAMADL